MLDTILNFFHSLKNMIMHSMRTSTASWVALGLLVGILVVRGVIKKWKGRKQDKNKIANKTATTD